MKMMTMRNNAKMIISAWFTFGKVEMQATWVG